MRIIVRSPLFLLRHMETKKCGCRRCAGEPSNSWLSHLTAQLYWRVFERPWESKAKTEFSKVLTRGKLWPASNQFDPGTRRTDIANLIKSSDEVRLLKQFLRRLKWSRPPHQRY